MTMVPNEVAAMIETAVRQERARCLGWLRKEDWVPAEENVFDAIIEAIESGAQL